jgi:hypothetical protein
MFMAILWNCLTSEMENLLSTLLSQRIGDNSHLITFKSRPLVHQLVMKQISDHIDLTTKRKEVRAIYTVCFMR